MSAIAALTLNDGATTPVAHTFSPVNIDTSGIAKWADRSGGVAVGFPIATLSLRSPSKASRNYRITGKVVYPITEVVAPSTYPVKVYDLIGTFELVLPERSTLQQRKDILAYAKNFFSNAVVTSGVENFENVY